MASRLAGGCTAHSSRLNGSPYPGIPRVVHGVSRLAVSAYVFAYAGSGRLLGPWLPVERRSSRFGERGLVGSATVQLLAFVPMRQRWVGARACRDLSSWPCSGVGPIPIPMHAQRAKMGRVGATPATGARTCGRRASYSHVGGGFGAVSATAPNPSSRDMRAGMRGGGDTDAVDAFWDGRARPSIPIKLASLELPLAPRFSLEWLVSNARWADRPIDRGVKQSSVSAGEEAHCPGNKPRSGNSGARRTGPLVNTSEKFEVRLGPWMTDLSAHDWTWREMLTDRSRPLSNMGQHPLLSELIRSTCIVPATSCTLPRVGGRVRHWESVEHNFMGGAGHASMVIDAVRL